MSRAKKWIFRVVTAGLGLALVFLLGEVSLRVIYAADQARGGDLQQRLERSRQRSLDENGGDFNMSGLVQANPFPDIVYELKPNLEGTFRQKRLRSNSAGLRDQEYPVEKPAGTCRIAGLGDSVMFGWGVHQGECYLDLLEERLNASAGPDCRFEVLNFALPGYNTAMEVAVFERKVLAYSPDVVIIQFVNNDFGAPMFMERPRNVYSWRQSYLLEFLRRRFGWWQEQKAHDGVLADGNLIVHNHEEAERVADQYLYMLGEPGYRQAMARLAELTHPRGIPVIIIRGTSSAEQTAILNSVAAEHGFHLVEIQPYTDRFVTREGIEDTPKARRKALWVGPSDHHPNARAHTIYVDALWDKLAELGVVIP